MPASLLHGLGSSLRETDVGLGVGQLLDIGELLGRALGTAEPGAAVG